MAGTDRSKTAAAGAGPAIVLVKPQLGENIGASARAMLNFGLTELRLVDPRDGWPSETARANASGADAVIDGATVHDGTEAAVADCGRVYATTARPRYMIKPVLTPREAAAEIRGQIAAGVKVGILFGGERAGLDNDDVARADTVITAPLNPAFSSLNLAQAVLLVASEWWQAGDPPATPGAEQAPPAPKERLYTLYRHLEQELEAAGFFIVPEKKAGMIRTIRNLIARAQPTDQEVGVLHGIVTALSGRRLGGAERRRPRATAEADGEGAG